MSNERQKDSNYRFSAIYPWIRNLDFTLDEDWSPFIDYAPKEDFNPVEEACVFATINGLGELFNYAHGYLGNSETLANYIGMDRNLVKGYLLDLLKKDYIQIIEPSDSPFSKTFNLTLSEKFLQQLRPSSETSLTAEDLSDKKKVRYF